VSGGDFERWSALAGVLAAVLFLVAVWRRTE